MDVYSFGGGIVLGAATAGLAAAALHFTSSDGQPTGAAEAKQAKSARQEGPKSTATAALETADSSRTKLTPAEIHRYSRQMIAPGFGGSPSQLRLKAARVLVIGCGGLGCPVALYLAGAGVGSIALVDDDVVDDSNLHRQIAHTTDRLGQSKTSSLRASILALNPATAVSTPLDTRRMNARDAFELIGSGNYDLVLDCTDNPAARYTVSDACVAAQVPLVSGAALGSDGQLSVYCWEQVREREGLPRATTGSAAPRRRAPCYRCFHPEPPPADDVKTCADDGVLGPVVGVVGSFMACEGIKLLVGAGTSLAGRLLVLDAMGVVVRAARMRGRRPDCFACGGLGDDAEGTEAEDAGAGDEELKGPTAEGTSSWIREKGLSSFEGGQGCEACADGEGEDVGEGEGEGEGQQGAALGELEVGALGAMDALEAALRDAEEQEGNGKLGGSAKGHSAASGPRWRMYVPGPEEVLAGREQLKAALAPGASGADQDAAAEPAGAGNTGAASGAGDGSSIAAPGSASSAPTALPLVVDVRDDSQWSVVRLPGSLHLPLELLKSRRTRERAIALVQRWVRAARGGVDDGTEGAGEGEESGGPAVVTLCRRGVRSLTAAEILSKAGVPAKSAAGGLKEIRASIDGDLPSYW